MKTQSNLIRFREIYTYLNEETLSQALKEGHDNLLTGMLREGLNKVSVACILIAMGESLKADFINLLWRYTNHEDPFTRESAYMALFNYPDQEKPQYNYFLTKFKNNLMEEKSSGVRQRLEDCIHYFETMEIIS